MSKITEQKTVSKIRNIMRVVTLSLQFLGDLASLISFALLVYKGFSVLYHAVNLNSKNPFDFLKEILHCLEILFIAPIPLLIISSFRRYILYLYEPPSENAPTNDDKGSFLQIVNPDVAKKAFISSLIGVTSTFLLGKLIEVMDVPGEGFANERISHDYIIVVLIALLFLFVQILLYKWLSDHHDK